MSMATRPPVSPSRSPTGRLPSPPPIAEDQSAPQSPHLSGAEEPNGHHGPSPSDQAAARRIRPGAKAADMAGGPPLVELGDIDSPFQLTEHLKSLHYSFTNPESLPLTQPLSKEQATLLSQPPSGIDRSLWLYELCRFLVQKVNSVIVALFADSPACSSQTCPEMRASEWQYLCAVHDPPKACCAIDYCCHTLDWAANTLTSPKHFPSRLSLGTENTAPQHQVRQLTNIFRRVYRIFAHAWFSHREMFWRTEGRTGLYVFFKTVCDNYNLIPEDNYTIPSEAEGKEPADLLTAVQQPQAAPTSILKRTSGSEAPQSDTNEDPATTPGLMPSATARRHRQTPSKGAPVGTVMEENEDDDDDKDDRYQSLLSPSAVLHPSTASANGQDEDVPLPGVVRSNTQIHSPLSSPVALMTLSPDPATGLASEPDADGINEISIAADIPTAVASDASVIDNYSGKSFPGFSPTSPKASTLEEFEQQNVEEEKPLIQADSPPDTVNSSATGD